MRTLCVLICLAVTASVSTAQSLAEIAEKEKERRRKLPASKVIRDQDLATAQGNVSVTGSEAEPESIDTAPTPAAPVEEEPESDWPRVFASCRSRYDAAKAVRDQKQDLIVNGLPIGTDLERIPCSRIMINEFMPGWIQYAIDCERLQEEMKAQETVMVEIQEECLNEARIRNIPPGGARLN